MSLTCKCVVVGESNVGKTSLLEAYPTAEDIAGRFDDSIRIVHKSKKRPGVGRELLAHYYDIDPSIIDEPAFGFALKSTNTIILCFALDDPESITILRTQFLPKIKETNPDTPLLLVGTKSDLRDQLKKEGYQYNYITTEQGLELQNEIGALRYEECSAVTGEGIQEIYDDVLWMNYERFIKSGKH